MPIKFAPCSCCSTCTVYTNGFNVADTGDIGPDLVEASGAWEINTTRLRGTSNGIALYDTVLSQATYQVRSWLRSTTSGDQIGQVVYYTSSSNYYSAILTVGTGATLKLFKTSGGSTTELGSKSVTAAINTDHLLTLCVSMFGSDVRLSAQLNGVATLTRTDTGTDLSGPGKAGVFRKSASGTTEWDDLEITLSEGDCPPCVLECACSGEVPNELQVTVAGYSGFCASWNGTYTLAHENRCSSCQWGYYISPAGPCSLVHVFAVLSATTLTVTMGMNFPCNLGTPAGFATVFSGTVSADCTTWSGVVLPATTLGSCCGSVAGTTATVTALAA